MNNSFLSELSKFDKRRLKPTLTKITYADGKAFLRKKDAYNEEKEILTEIDTNEQQTEDQTGSIYWSRNLGYLVDLVEDLSIDEIIPRLYLSGDDVVTKRDILRNKNITHVLNLTTNVCNVFESEISYKRIFIADFPEQKINEYFSETFEFIDNALINETNSVLVHCNAGKYLDISMCLFVYCLFIRLSIIFKKF